MYYLMILSEKVEIVIQNNIRKYYSDLGYDIPKKRNSIIEVYVKDLMLNSNVKIQCKCSVCNDINELSYYNYNKNIEKYKFYSCKKCSNFKRIKTCNNLYNVDNVFQYSEVKEKSKETLMLKYGVDNINKLDATKVSHKKRNKKLYGDKYYFNTTDFKEKSNKTIKELYGDVDNVFQAEIIKCRIKNHYLDKYDVEYPSQVEEIHIKQQISGFKCKRFKGLNYRGTYELDFLKNFYDVGIDNAPSINYIFENKDKIYFPDFYYKPLNLIIEIKSCYTYEKYIDKNKAKGKSCIEQGYNYILILDKKYDEFISILNSTS